MCDLQLWKVITSLSEILVFLDSMEISLSQDFIHMPVEVIGYWSLPERVNR